MDKDLSNVPLVHIRDFEPIPPEVLAMLPEGLVKKSMIIPLASRAGRLLAAVPKATGVVKPEGLKMVAGCPVDLVLAPVEEIIAFIKDHYSTEGKTLTAPVEPPVSKPPFVEPPPPPVFKALPIEPAPALED